MTSLDNFYNNTSAADAALRKYSDQVEVLLHMSKRRALIQHALPPVIDADLCGGNI